MNSHPLSGLQTCAKCGACSTVCPVYRQTGREYHTGRGKLHLLGKLDPAAASHTYAEILSHCLLCGACSRVCSRNIPVAELLAAARADLTRRAGKQVLLRALGCGVLGRPRLLKTVAPLARLLHGIRLPADSGLNLRLGLEPEKAQTPAASPATEQPTEEQAAPWAACREADNAPSSPAPYIFSGCFAAYIEPRITRSLTALLERSGTTPAGTAPGWACCGLAAYSCGQLEEARRLARINIAAHPGDSPIVVACASCAAHLSRYPELLADDPQWHRPAEEFAGRIREFSQFLCRQHPPDPAPSATEDGAADRRPSQDTTAGGPRGKHLPTTSGETPVKVLYHDPCHLRYGLQITKEPRMLLERVPGLELTELPGGQKCCGHGGLFHLAHPDSAQAILNELCNDAHLSGARLITTACTGCLLHWRHARHQGLHRAGVIHLAVLLDRFTTPK